MEATIHMPAIIVVLHLVNLFCLILLIRSGIQILYDHPKLYWTDHTSDENWWIRFGKKQQPKDRLWTARDEAESPPKRALALPGAQDFLGGGRHWHFVSAIIWTITGTIYIGFMLISGEWSRLIPTSLQVFPEAINVLGQYLTLDIPPEGATYNALQQITYALIVFVLAPLQILTGLAMSPAFIGRFPKFLVLFGGRRQVARSLHFLGMIGFSLFILIHITITMGLHFYSSIGLFVSGNANMDFGKALTLFLIIAVLILAFNIWATLFTLRNPIKLRGALIKFYTPVNRLLFGRLKSRQKYSKKDISPFFRVNGYPPKTDEYQELRKNDFKDYRLKVYGMVENPLELSLEDIKAIEKQTQVTLHNCIQGWSGVAEWSGAPTREILKLCKPTKGAKYAVFHCFDVYADGYPYYSSVRTSDLKDDQTILAYEMNGEALPLNYGDPIRLRVENKVGYKMAKWVKAIEFTDDYSKIGRGRGGYREDTLLFDWEASI
jgi:DMSO/TMAO reductase YedYZ molybdopterin-dependent catalytic subunit/thiosulfate reductase cytochrome b subunit